MLFDVNDDPKEVGGGGFPVVVVVVGVLVVVKGRDASVPSVRRYEE